MQRVLVVLPSLSPTAGAEQSTAALLPFVVEAGIDVHIAVLTSSTGLLPELLERGVSFHDLSGLGFAQRVIALRRLIGDIQPDLIHAALFDAELPTQLAARGTGVPVLITWASTPAASDDDVVAPWKLKVVHAIEYGMAHLRRVRFHAVTDGVAQTQRAWLHVRASRVAVGERGRNAHDFPLRSEAGRVEARQRRGVGPDELVVLNIGRQEPQKGQVDLIHSFEEVHNAVPQARLWIAGREGRSTAAVLAAVRSASCSDSIELLGHRDDVADLIQAADVVVCSSLREGAAGALIEAMAVGTPIVSVHLDGLVGVLQDGRNSRFVDRSMLSSALIETLTERTAAEARAQVARAMFEQRFTTSGAAKRLVDIYRWAAT